jgi:hypothetical protein
MSRNISLINQINRIILDFSGSSRLDRSSPRGVNGQIAAGRLAAAGSIRCRPKSTNGLPVASRSSSAVVGREEVRSCGAGDGSTCADQPRDGPPGNSPQACLGSSVPSWSGPQEHPLRVVLCNALGSDALASGLSGTICAARGERHGIRAAQARRAIQGRRRCDCVARLSESRRAKRTECQAYRLSSFNDYGPRADSIPF